MKPAPAASINDYIAGFPPAIQARLKQIRGIVRRAAPDAKEAIKYQIPTFVLGENLVHFAAFKNHIGFYPTSSGIRAFAALLAGFKSAKGSVQFPHDQTLPLDLIRKITEFRVGEVRRKRPVKKSRVS